MKDRSGVTLVELLIALALAALILALLGGLLASARAAESGLGGNVEPRAALALAAELMREEMAMSGFVPYGLTSADSGGDSGTTGGPENRTLLVMANPAAGNAVGVKFVDDRLVSGPIQRDLIFSTGIDSRGEAQLYRQSEAQSARQPLVAGISSLTVVAYLDESGLQPLPSAGGGVELHEAVRAIVLELRAPTGEHRTVLIELPSRPQVRFEP